MGIPTEVDHLMCHAADGAAAARLLAVLGFTSTPVSRIEAMGIDNRLVLFEDAAPGAANFIEFMTVADPARLPPPMRPLLSGSDGGRMLVLATGEAVAAHRHLTSVGFAFAPPVHVRREWKLDDGSSLFPEFDVLLPAVTVPVFNACRYRDVSPYRRESWTRHANGARRLDAVYCVAADPQNIAMTMARAFAHDARMAGDRWIAAGSGATTLEVFSPDAFERAFGLRVSPSHGDAVYAGVRLVAPDPGTARTLAQRAGLAAREIGQDGIAFEALGLLMHVIRG